MGEVHFFQRFSQRENVATNNTLLLLSRLYEYDRELFQEVVTERLSKNLRVGVSFSQQTRSGRGTVPDGMFGQQGFRVVIETKMGRQWRPEQIKGHLSALEGKEEVRLLLLLSPEPLNASILNQVTQLVKEHGKGVSPVPVTFAELIAKIREGLRDRDYEMADIVDDFEGFAAHAGLLPQTASLMRVVPCGLTWQDNERMRLYYEPVERGSAPHKFLGIYADKCVRLIGEVTKTLVASVTNASTNPVVSGENFSADDQKAIIAAWLDAEKHGWVGDGPRKFTFVEKFYRTSFRKISSGGMRKHRNFNLRDQSLLGLAFTEGLSCQAVAEMLAALTWE